MSESIRDMINWLKQYYNDKFYIIITIAALIYLFTVKKEHRKALICPLIVIILCIFNPFLYQKFLIGVSYWRMFWMIPDAMLIAYVITDIIKRLKPIYGKVIILLSFIVLIVCIGTNMYNRELFCKIQNPQKVSPQTKEICDVILSVDKHPKCIIPDGMYIEARQYNGDIELMYGRNAEGYINELPEKYMYVHYYMWTDSPNYEYVFEAAKRDGYNFVVCNKNKPVPDDILDKYGYGDCLDAGGYWVYCKER